MMENHVLSDCSQDPLIPAKSAEQKKDEAVAGGVADWSEACYGVWVLRGVDDEPLARAERYRNPLTEEVKWFCYLVFPYRETCPYMMVGEAATSEASLDLILLNIKRLRDSYTLILDSIVSAALAKYLEEHDVHEVG